MPPAASREASQEASRRTRLDKVLPGIAALRGYRRAWLAADVVAGVSVAAYLVPQVMAYSALVGVPATAGLAAAVAAGLVYAVVGTSRLLSVGPEATTALLAGSTLAPLAAGDPQRAAALASLLAVVVAGWCLLARLLHLGVLADLLSRPILVGYLAGVAVTMMASQLGRITGTTVKGDGVLAELSSFWQVAGQVHLLSFEVAAATLALLVALRLAQRTGGKLHRLPVTLLSVITATVAVQVLGLRQRGVAVVGALPDALPHLTLPSFSVSDVSTMALAGLGLAMVGFSDNVLTGRAFAERGEERDAESELTALAAVNLAAGLVQGYPVSSSGSRTALARLSGARTPLYQVACAVTVLLAMAVAGPALGAVPVATLGALVIFAATQLIEGHEFVRLARFRAGELLLAVGALFATLLFGILVGIAVAIGLSVADLLIRVARPHAATLGLVPGLAGMHDAAEHPGATTVPGLVIFRYDAPLCFANAENLRLRAYKAVVADRTHTPVQWFVLDCEAAAEIDITAADALSSLVDQLHDENVMVGLVRVKTELGAMLARAGVLDRLAVDMVFATLPTCVSAFRERSGTSTPQS